MTQEQFEKAQNLIKKINYLKNQSETYHYYYKEMEMSIKSLSKDDLEYNHYTKIKLELPITEELMEFIKYKIDIAKETIISFTEEFDNI